MDNNDENYTFLAGAANDTEYVKNLRMLCTVIHNIYNLENIPGGIDTSKLFNQMAEINDKSVQGIDKVCKRMTIIEENISYTMRHNTNKLGLGNP